MSRAQVRAEWVKLSTVRSTWVVLGLVLLVEVLLRIVGVLVAPSSATTDDTLLALRPSILFPTSLVLLPAVLATGEWRHGTVVTTYVLRPARDQVLAAKLLVGAVSGLAAALVLGGVASAAALIAASSRGLPFPDGEQLTLLVASAVVSGPVLGALAVAVGHLLRDQNATVTVLVVTLFVLPLPVALVDPRAYAWTPSGLADGAAGLRAADASLLAVVPAALSLALLTLLLSVAAFRRLGRRDLV